MAKLTKFPQDMIIGFNLAKEISNNLDLETQIWLIDYLQYLYWQTEQPLHLIESLEKSKKLLQGYVQPRLVWDCLFLQNIEKISD
jgi:DNA polymerase-3 subunit delta'